jgi:hypothetical protein
VIVPFVSSWPGKAARRTASLPLAYDPAIHVFAATDKEYVDARHKAGHDEFDENDASTAAAPA